MGASHCDHANAQSFQQKRLILDFDKGKGGRDAAHFMYQLYQNGQGSSQFPRHYRRPVYFVLLPDFWRTPGICWRGMESCCNMESWRCSCFVPQDGPATACFNERDAQRQRTYVATICQRNMDKGHPSIDWEFNRGVAHIWDHLGGVES